MSMKQSFLKEPRPVLEVLHRRKKVLCVAVFVVAAFLNILITVLHTRQTHTPMLLLNIAIDLAALWTITWILTTDILPTCRLLRIDDNPGRTVCGTVEAVSEKTERYCGFDCRVITVEKQKLFVIQNGTICLYPGENVTLQVVQGIVKEASK